jgi:hypothetical protein
MKTNTLFSFIVIALIALAQPARGGSHGGGGGGGGGHFGGGGRFSGGGARFSSGARHFASGGTRFSSSGMRSSPAFRSHAFAGNRFGRQGFNGRNHTFAREGANWHRDWDRRHDHFSGGHRFRFANGRWIIFDDGFYPYEFYPPYPYGYPYGYYPYNYDNY